MTAVSEGPSTAPQPKPPGGASGRPAWTRWRSRSQESGLPHGLLVDAAREAIAAGDPASAAERAAAMERSLLRGVINATGVLLHTNLGRAPLGTAAPGGAGPATPLRYSNLEFDTERGARGDRGMPMPAGCWRGSAGPRPPWW